MTTPTPDSPPAPSRASVFVSYAHEDRARARAVIEVLETAGFEVWWDGLIEPGTAFAASTERALEAAGAVVVLWSRDSVVSHWVRDEASHARDRGCLVPVSLDGSDPPLGFRQYLFISLAKWRGGADSPEIQAIINAVAAARGTARPMPLPRRPSPVNRPRRAVLAGSAALAALGLTAGGWWTWRRTRAAAPGAAAPPAAQTAPPAAPNSVAVLPFTNLSGDPGENYFSDGLSAEVRGALARDNRLRVIAQVSCDSFRDTKVNAVTIARTLDVAYLLDGNVRRAGRTFRIYAELIDGATGFSRWTQAFDRPIDDVFAVQREIAGSVAAALTAELRTVDPAGGESPPGGTTNLDAFDAYLRGRAAYNMSDGEASDRRALADFDAAIAADPHFAAAHAARSRSLIVIANQYTAANQTRALYDAAVAAAETATRLAPNLADAYSTLGFALFQGRLDVRAARHPYEVSRDLGPGEAAVLGRFALYGSLTGRADEAEPAMVHAVELDPLNPLVHRSLGSVRYAARRYVDAIAPIRHALSLNPKLNGAHAGIGHCLLLMSRYTEALTEFRAEPQALHRLPGLAIVARRLHDDRLAAASRAELRETLGDSALYQAAQVAAQWGETNDALQLLTRARAVGDSGLIYTLIDPLLDPLRTLPHFRALLHELAFD